MKTLLTLALTYFTVSALSSCNSFFQFSNNSRAQRSNEATWSARIIQTGGKNKQMAFIILNFSPTGEVIAKCPSCDVKGYWYEDELTNKFVMSFDPADDLCELNKSWDVKLSGTSAVVLYSNDENGTITFTLRIT